MLLELQVLSLPRQACLSLQISPSGEQGGTVVATTRGRRRIALEQPLRALMLQRLSATTVLYVYPTHSHAGEYDTHLYVFIHSYVHSTVSRPARGREEQRERVI